MIQWSAEELALMREIDAEADRGHLTMDELRESYNRDREARHSDSKSAKYHREYYQANKEKIAEWQREYYQANKEKIAEQKREYYQANKEKIAEWQREYYQANKEKIAEQRRGKRKAAQGVRAPERQWPKGPQKTNPSIV